jgi:hypothetical protein
MVELISDSWRISWICRHTWRRATVNTLWCLVGCSIGDIGTIGFFQLTGIAWPTTAIMVLAMVNGIMTSIALESVILSKQMAWGVAFRTACGMSLISMLSMEAAMNIVDIAVTGEARISLVVLPWMLVAGFATPLPYNYWRLKAFGKACH